MTTIVLVSNDLMGSSRLEGAARQAHAELRMLGAVPAVVEFCTAQAVPLVIVDLTTAGLEIAALVTELKSLANAPAIAAFGPHVHEAALAAAQAAGCDVVVTRGQMMSQAAALIAHFCK